MANVTSVWSVTINGRNDCVVMTDFEAMQVKMKFAPNILMHNMTELHSMKPQHLHKQARKQVTLTATPSMCWANLAEKSGVAIQAQWEYEDLMKMDANNVR